MALNADKAYLLILIPIIIAAAVFIIKKRNCQGQQVYMGINGNKNNNGVLPYYGIKRNEHNR